MFEASLPTGAPDLAVDALPTREDAALGFDGLARTNATYAAACALLDELALGGVSAVSICPGSRSAPLAVAAASHPALACTVHVDERSAAFFALGRAKASGAPGAVVCTSGTAAANFLPAVVEAHHDRVPLLLLTADRPPALRDWGAPQTIRQPGLYAAFVRFEAETELPAAASYREAPLRSLACRAVHEATGARPGPVHLNVPFDEPLDPAPDPAFRAPSARRQSPAMRRCGAAPTPTPALVDELAQATRERRGVVVCGPQRAAPDLCEAILELSSAAGWPVVADLASQLRCGPYAPGRAILSAADAWLRDERLAAEFRPEIVLELGSPPTSKVLGGWLAGSGAERWKVDPGGGRLDPGRQVGLWLEVDPAALCVRLARRCARDAAARAGDGWSDRWVAADARARTELDRALAEEGALDGVRVAHRLLEALPDGATLQLSNSLAIRDAELAAAVGSRRLRVFTNRGANGIDGIVSSALGAAAGSEGPLALLVGDLAFLHDLPALARARHHDVSATIVVLDDDGGGIFSHLPVAAHDGALDFDALFRVPHGARLGALAGGFGLDHVRVRDAEHLADAVRHSLETPGVQVIEAPIDPRRNLLAHRALWARAAAAAGAAR